MDRPLRGARPILGPARRPGTHAAGRRAFAKAVPALSDPRMTPRHRTTPRHWKRHGTGQSHCTALKGTALDSHTARDLTALDSQDLDLQCHGTGPTALDSQDLDLQRSGTHGTGPLTALDSQDLDLQRSGNPSTQASKGAISREDRIQLRTVFKTTGRLECACTVRSPSARRRAKQIVADDGSALRWPETWKRVALSARL